MGQRHLSRPERTTGSSIVWTPIVPPKHWAPITFRFARAPLNAWETHLTGNAERVTSFGHALVFAFLLDLTGFPTPLQAWAPGLRPPVFCRLVGEPLAPGGTSENRLPPRISSAVWGRRDYAHKPF